MPANPEIVIQGIPDFNRSDISDILRQVKECGVTAVQIYTFWKDFEPNRRGAFEWEYFDRQVSLIQEAGMKYVPFILIGPKYASPAWWLDDPNHVGLRCLEHGKESPIDSIWNPLLRKEIDRVLKAFAGHYLPWGVIESVQPGICGDYGESIMPAMGNWPGDYHTHMGYWMADDLAMASFREWLRDKYGGIQALNSAWDYFYASFDEIKTFLPHMAHSRTALFDELDWYKDSMTSFVDFWMSACREHFPDTPIYMCTGGQEEPELAALFSAQAKVCAKYGGGIRLTNECNRFYENFFLTSYTHSACEFYGAYLGLEPVGPLTPEGVAARMFGSAVYGNRQIFYYYNNIFKTPDENDPSIRDARTRRFTQYLPLIGERETACEAAFFWPCYLGALGKGIPEGIEPIITYIRKRANIMPVNDRMVMDGALERHKLLIMPVEAFSRAETLLRIRDWTLKGGKLFAVGRMFGIELEPVPEYDELFGILPSSEKTAGHGAVFTVRDSRFRRFAEYGAYRAAHGWMDMHPETIELSKADFKEGISGTRVMPAANAFMREYPSGGAAIAYFGPVEFEYDPQSVKSQRPVFTELLADVLDMCANSAEMETRPGETARGYIGGKLRALLDGGEIAER